MRATSEEVERGLRAYEQKRAFEALRRRGLPWIYAGLAFLNWVLFGALVGSGRGGWLTWGFFAAAAGLSAVWWAGWARLRRQYGENCALLAELEGRYGDELPWREVELQRARLEEIAGEDGGF